ncbi:MAG TPA: hypothetical protein VKF40_29290 [Burkholderiales bacterium]|nr:hypothetical protein [Burkholderiales bacterium]
MLARLTTKSEPDVIAAIHALDLESVKARVRDPELGEGWTRDYADRIEAAYKTYLTMLVKYPDEAEDILLSKDVDEFWHTHILQTRKYTEDCQKVFGNFLHHEPHVGEVTAADLIKRSALAEKTRRLYALEFGGEDKADAAWSGQTTRAEDASYSAASIRRDVVAHSAVGSHGENAAYSAASVGAATAAYSAASIRSRNAAYSAASIRSEHAAYSAASIRSDNAAYSAAGMRAEEAAYYPGATRAKGDPASIDSTMSG